MGTFPTKVNGVPIVRKGTADTPGSPVPSRNERSHSRRLYVFPLSTERWSLTPHIRCHDGLGRTTEGRPRGCGAASHNTKRRRKEYTPPTGHAAAAFHLIYKTLNANRSTGLSPNLSSFSLFPLGYYLRTLKLTPQACICPITELQL